MNDNKADRIIELISGDEKLMNSKSIRRTYSDEPVLKRASQLKNDMIPQKISEMRAMAYTNEAFWKTSQWLFYTQGSFMADYDDVYDFNEDFVCYYPNYANMTVVQLRGFFSWRSRIRNGEFPPAPDAFVKLLSYEIINGIGCSDHKEGYFLLKKLRKTYGGNKYLAADLAGWERDMLIYYDLPELFDDCDALEVHRKMLKICKYDESSDEELFDAVCALSNYDLTSSVSFGDNETLFRRTAVMTLRKISDYFRDHRKNSYFTKLFGKGTVKTVRMFDAAVFYQQNHPKSRTVTINEICQYSCFSGVWQCFSYQGNGRSKVLGELMRYVDCLLRDHLNFRHRLTSVEVPKNEGKIINAVIAEIEAEEQLKKAREVKIDLSRLPQIRADADIIRDRLIVEEYEDEPEESVQVQEESTENAEEGILTPEEKALVIDLLNGNHKPAAGTLTSVLADSINEKLFDIFADTVIIFDGDTPEIIEDYSDELLSMSEKGEL